MSDQPVLFRPTAAEGLAAERAELLEALDEHTAVLDAVDDALGRLEQGTYGTCERCGARLGDELLGSDPLAARCGEHCAAADPGDHTDVQAAPVPPAP